LIRAPCHGKERRLLHLVRHDRGFDHHSPSIFDLMPKFLAEPHIAAALISMLHSAVKAEA